MNAPKPDPPAAPSPSQSPPAVGPSDTSTRPSIFIRLRESEPAPREVAWRQFYDRYAPVIADYARRKGAGAQQADEVVQDVVAGFFAASPRFVYNPSRGRFRAYLRTCACHALARIGSAMVPAQDVPIERLTAIVDERDKELWERLWQQHVLRRAIDLVREHYALRGKLETFLAFEQNVIFSRPAQDVARELNMNVTSVHAAKSRVTAKLRETRASIEAESE